MLDSGMGRDGGLVMVPSAHTPPLGAPQGREDKPPAEVPT